MGAVHAYLHIDPRCTTRETRGEEWHRPGSFIVMLAKCGKRYASQYTASGAGKAIEMPANDAKILIAERPRFGDIEREWIISAGVCSVW